MALKADKDGFLVGEGEGIRFRSLADAYGVLKGIKADTGAIVSLLKGVKAQPLRAASPRKSPGASVLASSGPAVTASYRAGRNTPRAVAGAAATAQRDSRGRFIGSAKAKPSVSVDDPVEPRESSSRGGLIRRLSEALKTGVMDAVSAGSGGTEQVDPSLMAAKEISDTIAPVTGAIGKIGGAIFGKEDREEKRQAKISAKEQERQNRPWYKRFEKKLNAIANTKVSGGGSSGMMLSLFISLLGKLLIPLVALKAGLSALAAGIPGVAKLLPGLARLATPVAAMFSAFKSFNTSTEEYAKRLGVELNGSLAQELGVRFVGALGDLGNTLTFGLAEKFGQWLSANVPNPFEKIAEAKDYVGGKFKDRFAAAKALITGSNSANRARLEAAADRAGITDPKERAAFLAQNHHESGGFRQLEENLNYSPDRLLEVSAAARAKGRAAAVRASRAGPKAVAELMYGGRMGNAEPGDAYKYRGRGFTQLTGRNQYAEASKALGIDLVNNPDLASDPDIAARISAWHWRKSGAGASARAGNISATTRAVNGGYNGIAQRGRLTAAYAASQAPASSGAAPAADRFRVPKIETSPQRLNSAKTPPPAVNVNIPVPLTQNVGDRSIANLATGGMGGKGDSM